MPIQPQNLLFRISAIFLLLFGGVTCCLAQSNAEWVLYGGVHYSALKNNTNNAQTHPGVDAGLGLVFRTSNRSEHWVTFGYQSNELSNITSYSTTVATPTTHTRDVSFKSHLITVGYAYALYVVPDKISLTAGLEFGVNAGNLKATNVDEYSDYSFYPVTSSSTFLSKHSVKVDFVEQGKIHTFPKLGFQYTITHYCVMQFAYAPDLNPFFSSDSKYHMGEVSMNQFRMNIFSNLTIRRHPLFNIAYDTYS